MVFVALMAFAAIIALIATIHKSSARMRFKRSVDLYERSRLQRIAEGVPSYQIPTVEQFLESRGELHLLEQIDRITISQSSDNVISYHNILQTHEDNDDDGYQTFVADMWARDGIDLKGFFLKRLSQTGPILCQLHALVESTPGRLYLNLFEDGEPKTYAADSRHKWMHDDDAVDYTAFIGIMKGADPRKALKGDTYPRSIEQAISSEFDRFATSDKRYVLGYQSFKGMSYRVVSRVIRYEDRFSARCHYRWGERRTFRNEGLLNVFDLQSRICIDVTTFLTKRK